MAVDARLVEHIAHLSRLCLEPAELLELGGELERIIEYVERLSEIDTTAIEPAISAASGPAPLRPDRPTPGLTRRQALQNAPDPSAEGFRVPPVLGGEG